MFLLQAQTKHSRGLTAAHAARSTASSTGPGERVRLGTASGPLMFLDPNSHPWRCLQVTARGRRGGLQGSWQSLRSLKGSGVWLEDATRGKAAEVKFSDQHTKCEKSNEFGVLEAVPQEQTAASHRLVNTPVAWEEREVTEGVELALVAAVATSREGGGGHGPPCRGWARWPRCGVRAGGLWARPSFAAPSLARFQDARRSSFISWIQIHHNK